MPQSRHDICQSASQKLKAKVADLKTIKSVVGFDGFVDNIIAVVDKRHSSTHYEPMKTIDVLGKKITAAAGESSNYELVVKQQKLGGNGPIMANALASFGLDVTYVGNLGFPAINPVFAEFAKRARVITVAEPGVTDALEFEDGKLMMGKHQFLGDVTWDNLVARVGLEKLIGMFGESKLIGTVNWTMLPHMSAIWEKVIAEVLPKIDGKGRRLFVDLADPEKRTPQDIKQALELLSKMQGHIDVILGLNLKESGEIAHVLGLPEPAQPEAHLEETAKAIRDALGIYCVVVHPRKGAAAATASETASFAGPFVQQPKISTGAGDHFNAGFCLGMTLGLSLAESLCTGCATSGFYVRSAQSPSGVELANFIEELPPPQA